MEVITCTNCFQVNISGVVRCSRCHRSLEQSNEVCPNCGKNNLENHWICSTCGGNLSLDKDADFATEEVFQRENSTLSNLATIADIVAEQDVSLTDQLFLNSHAAMLKEIRSWGFGFLVLGIFFIVLTGNLQSTWGILLLIISLASFYFRTASMFVVYAGILAWTALLNLISLEIGWVLFALFQIFLTIRVFRKYRRFRDVEMEVDKINSIYPTPIVSSAGRAARIFPLIGSLLSCSSIVGLILFIFLGVVLAIANEGVASIPDSFDFIYLAMINFSVLGFSVGLASVLSKFHPKALSIIGLVAGAFTLVLVFASVIFYLFS